MNKSNKFTRASIIGGSVACRFTPSFSGLPARPAGTPTHEWQMLGGWKTGAVQSGTPNLAGCGESA
jgi:hypothetical protein